jgi:two-component system nitrate/nitrite response regulator NarL
LIDQSFGLKAIFEFVALLRREKLHGECIVWATDLTEVETFRAFQLGIRGVLRKTLAIDRLVDCIRQVAAGSIWLENATHAAGLVQRRDSARLTPREREVVRLVCRGLKNKQIAETLRITPGTVKVHLMHVFEKTGLKDRYSLAMHGWDFPAEEKEIKLKPETG